MARKRAHRRAVLPMGDIFAVGGCDCSCNASVCENCTPCSLPTAGLNVSWTATGTIPASNANLTWNGTAWISSCTPYSTSGTLSWIVIQLACVADVLVFSVSLYSANTCAAGVLIATCSTPVSSGFTAGAPTSCQLGTILYTPSAVNCPSLSTYFTLNIPSNSCHGGTKCYGCNILPLSGENINIYNHSGGTLLETDTCDSNGIFYSTLASGTYYAIPTNGRFLGSNFSMGYTIDFNPAPGYACIYGCADPLKTTLHFTDTVYGSWNLTYSGIAQAWSGSPTTQPAYPGCCSSCGISSPLSLTAELLSIGSFLYCNGAVCMAETTISTYMTCPTPGPFQYQEGFSSSSGCSGCPFGPDWTSWLCASSTTITITE